MEVKKGRESAEAEQLNRFWPYYHRHAWKMLMGSQLVISLFFTGAVLPLWPFPIEMVAVFISINLIAFVLMSLLLDRLLRPLKDISEALVHVSGELSKDAAPNLNDDYYEKRRVRPLLKTIYEMALSQGDEKPKPTGDSTASKPIEVASALNHTATGVVMLDESGTIIYANQSAPVKTDEQGNKHLSLIFDSDDTIEEWLKARDAHDIHAEHAWRRISDKPVGEEDRHLYDIFVSYEKGSEAETIITLFDRTGDYAPEDDELDFIAFAAHELRGPITVIRGYLDTLNDELKASIDDDQKELFQRLIVSANRLSGYVNNILNASKFDRRHLKIHLRETTLHEIYDSIADDMQLRAASQGRLLSIDFPEVLPTVAADANSMSEVLGNLIDNAVKYSNEGGTIEVTAKVSGTFVETSVTDHGIGMPGNVVQNLFHKFYRSHRSRETVAGTGIGLYISKAIVESNGGEVGVRSVEGRGSTFTFTLPIYATVADKLSQDGANNQTFIEHASGSWIKNHGAFRG